MFTVNSPFLNPLLSARNLAWLGGFMLVFWAPFWGGHRLPIILLLGLGLFFHLQSRHILPHTRAEQRWGWILLPLLLPCLVSAPFSLTPQGSYTVCLVLALHYWVGLALLRGMDNGGHATLARWIGLTLLFWSVDGVVQLALDRDLFGVPLVPTELRITGPFIDNLHMGLFICILMPLLLWPLAPGRPWLVLLLFIFMSTVAFLSGARTNLAFTTLVALALMFRLPAWKHRAALAVLCFLPLLAVPLSPVLKERVLQRDYIPTLSNSETKVDKPLFDQVNHVLSGRLWIWDTAANMVQAHPWLGVGPAAFDTAYPDYSKRPDDPLRVANEDGHHAYHAHQMYIGVAAETGLVGLAGLLTAIFLAGRWFWTAPLAARRNAAPYMVCLAVIAFPINSQPVLFSGWWFPIVLLLLCGMLAALEDMTSTPEPVHQ